MAGAATARPPGDSVLPRVISGLTDHCIAAIDRVGDPAGNRAGAAVDIVALDGRLLASVEVAVIFEPFGTRGPWRALGVTELAACAARATAQRDPLLLSLPFTVTVGAWSAQVAITGDLHDVDMADGGFRLLWRAP